MAVFTLTSYDKRGNLLETRTINPHTIVSLALTLTGMLGTAHTVCIAKKE